MSSGMSCPKPHGRREGACLPHCRPPPVIHPRPAEASFPIGLGVLTAPCVSSSAGPAAKQERREAQGTALCSVGPVAEVAQHPPCQRRRIREARGGTGRFEQ